jgi:hypothetical protein
MVDSSKTAWGLATAPFCFRRTPGRHFYLVHLVRDPRAVCWSTVQRAERSGNVRSNRALRCAFTTLGWWTANLACELFSWMYPDQYVRLCYEDLARSPREAVSRLFQKLVVEGEVQFEALGRAPNRHGNRMRRRPLSLGEIKEDRAWSSGMPLACSRGRQVRGRTLDVGDKSWYPASATMRSMKGNRWRAIRYIWRYHRDRVKFGLIFASMVLLFAAVHINLRSFSLSHYNLTNETD